MRSRPTLRSTSPEPAGRRPKGLPSTIVAVKSASERGRAELIRDVVDAYRRLYGSVQRFVLMLTDDRLNFASVGTSGSHSLNQLLSILAEQAKAAAFVRLRDLKASIEEARSAEQLRDAIFSDAFSNDLAALRKVVAELERLDTAFIGLCVGHVLDQHARAAGGAGPADIRRAADRTTATTPARTTAKASAKATAAASVTLTRRKSRAEPTLVHPND
ncbi:hypothetical protein [Paraburkholderia caffeinilytica]|uniref:Uncharacterized protein n=1 Tax=Paraburkholderia caffeinilytica TaxID=1761016 RepID=A0ABQ1MVR9_9BURK|nr:hypothetical protein [Paraburkholderia caffeinilytica]GGC47117.1 hypothetical protein GCM10011400_37910 [Paraburkholderia caffeinilytica]CAB3783185.1 hypothetical protein LMG28690_01541 [Paraburkholderia caffeinilytica]